MKIEFWPVDKPKDYPGNARKWSDKAIEKVALSIKTFGFVQPVVVDKKGVIIIGHLRRASARTIPLKEIPVHVASKLTPHQVRQLRLMDNRSHEEATWDEDILTAEMLDLKELDLDLSLTGFSSRELDAMLRSENPAEDDVPPVPVAPVSRPGDLWLCGEHRVLCGDSTDVGAVSRLFGGNKAKMLWTDPPYGVDYGSLVESRKNQKVGGWAAIEGDALDDAKLLALLTGSLSAPGATIAFVWHPPGARRFLFWDALRLNGWKPAQEVVWVKNALVFGRADYQWRHEPCIYARRGVAERQLDRTETTVWEENKPHNSEHPTQKPVALCSRPVRNHTTAGDVVFDPFLGSGTAVIAADGLDRICFGMEIDPAYTDVIVTRWQNLTGKQATLEGHDGLTFEHVREGRLLGAQDAIKEEAIASGKTKGNRKAG